VWSGKECKVTADVGAERLEVNRFQQLDCLPWQELEKLPDHDLCEFDQLNKDEIGALSDEQCESMEARDRERLLRKYRGRDPDELEEERDFDPSTEPEAFQRIWATDLAALTYEQLCHLREHKWPDDLDPDDVSDKARALWHRRIWTLTRDEFEEAHAYSKDRVVVSYFRFLDEQERRDNAREKQEMRMAQAKVIPLVPPQQTQPHPRDTPEHEAFFRGLDRRLAKKAREQAREEQQIDWKLVSDLAGETAPARRWLINEFVPMRNVTNYTGDGGIGKSLVALQLAVAVALGRKWLGMPVLESGPVIVYSAEDEFDETWRRLEDICREMPVEIGDLNNLHVASMAGMDAMLSVADDSRMMEPTPLWDKLVSKAEAVKPKLVVIDTSADVYGGDENTRQQVKQFVGMLVGLSFDVDCAVVLLSHPSVSGMIDGTGRSGTTGWNNAFRSRLYQDRVVMIVDGKPVELDPDLRVLRNNKLNYGRKGKEVRIRWKKGIFVNEDVAEISPTEANIAAENAFMACLAIKESQGRPVNDRKTGSYYAPKIFSSMTEAAGCNEHRLASAMERLFDDRQIHLHHEGKGSHQKTWISTKLPAGQVSEEPVTAEPATDTKLERAKQFLREQLAAGPVPSTGLYANAKEALISRTTLGRAAEELGVEFIQDAIGTTLSLPS
jgi:RecA-family ATPase